MDRIFTDSKVLIELLTEKLEYEGLHLTGSNYYDAISYARYSEFLLLYIKNQEASVSILLDRLGSYHSIIGNLDKALTFYEERSRLGKELYDAYPQNVSFKIGLAISYCKLGIFCKDQKTDEVTALSYFEKNEVLWQSLSNDFPKYEEFTRNLDWVQKAIKNLSL